MKTYIPVAAALMTLGQTVRWSELLPKQGGFFGDHNVRDYVVTKTAITWGVRRLVWADGGLLVDYLGIMKPTKWGETLDLSPFRMLPRHTCRIITYIYILGLGILQEPPSFKPRKDILGPVDRSKRNYIPHWNRPDVETGSTFFISLTGGMKFTKKKVYQMVVRLMVMNTLGSQSVT